MTQHVCPTCKHWHDPEASMVAISEAAAPLRAAKDVWPQRLDGHEPRWLQDRDDPTGMWTCGCGKTFAPDDFEGYHTHLAAIAAPSSPALDVERMGIAIVKSLPILAEWLREGAAMGVEGEVAAALAAEYERLQPEREAGE